MTEPAQSQAQRVSISDDAGVDGYANVLSRLVGLAVEATRNDGATFSGEIKGVSLVGFDHVITLYDDDSDQTHRVHVETLTDVRYL